MKLAEIAGTLNTTEVTEKLTLDQFYEWWAFGYLENWFPVDKDDSKMTPEEAMQAVAQRYS